MQKFINLDKIHHNMATEIFQEGLRQIARESKACQPKFFLPQWEVIGTENPNEIFESICEAYPCVVSTIPSLELTYSEVWEIVKMRLLSDYEKRVVLRREDDGLITVRVHNPIPPPLDERVICYDFNPKPNPENNTRDVLALFINKEGKLDARVLKAAPPIWQEIISGTPVQKASEAAPLVSKPVLSVSQEPIPAAQEPKPQVPEPAKVPKEDSVARLLREFVSREVATAIGYGISEGTIVYCPKLRFIPKMLTKIGLNNLSLIVVNEIPEKNISADREVVLTADASFNPCGKDFANSTVNGFSLNLSSLLGRDYRDSSDLVKVNFEPPIPIQDQSRREIPITVQSYSLHRGGSYLERVPAGRLVRARDADNVLVLQINKTGVVVRVVSLPTSWQRLIKNNTLVLLSGEPKKPEQVPAPVTKPTVVYEAPKALEPKIEPPSPAPGFSQLKETIDDQTIRSPDNPNLRFGNINRAPVTISHVLDNGKEGITTSITMSIEKVNFQSLITLLSLKSFSAAKAILRSLDNGLNMPDAALVLTITNQNGKPLLTASITGRPNWVISDETLATIKDPNIVLELAKNIQPEKVNRQDKVASAVVEERQDSIRPTSEPYQSKQPFQGNPAFDPTSRWPRRPRVKQEQLTPNQRAARQAAKKAGWSRYK